MVLAPRPFGFGAGAVSFFLLAVLASGGDTLECELTVPGGVCTDWGVVGSVPPGGVIGFSINRSR